MDQRSHYLPDSNRHSHRRQDREVHSRYVQQEWDQNHPPLDPRDRGRHWGHPESQYMAHFMPARAEQFPYSSQQYSYSYGWREQPRPQSRHGYEWPPHGHWDSRDSYGHNDYYRRQHAQQGGEQWADPYSWRTNERTHRQEGGETSNMEEHRWDYGNSSSLQSFREHEETPSRDDESSCYYPGTLERSKTSGLSSSSYELSQYMNGADLGDSDPWPATTSDTEHKAARQVPAPLKFSIPHAVVSFGPAGKLVRVTPHLSAPESVSQLQIHSMEVILSETQEQQEMRNFPGPLTREDLHKVDAIEFAHQKAEACMRDIKLHDKSSAALLWNLLILLCRQNGQMAGSDIAELLVQDFRSNGNGGSDAPTLIDFNEPASTVAPPTGGGDLLTGDLSSFRSESPEKALQSYTQLLLGGRKKEALESAMINGLWGHALFLASKMGSRSYTTVLNRFTSQLAASDPLQTLFQLLSGRIPSVALSCANKKWGDWRPHLAVMLSNEARDPAVQQKAIISMGDSLASRGLIHAAHVCYLTAGVPFGLFTNNAERLVLLGSSHRQTFGCFATNSAIQCTELYEYSQALGSKHFTTPSLQVYKFLYACRLLDFGLSSQAFHYCEVVGGALLKQREPDFVLTAEVIKLSDRLRHSEGQYGETVLSGALREPEWLHRLRTRHGSLQTGSYDRLQTHHLPLQSGFACEDRDVFLESDSDDSSCRVQDPEPELLYFRASEDQENITGQTGGRTEEVTETVYNREAQDWPDADTPALIGYAPPVLPVATSQNVPFYSADSVNVPSALSHCPLSNLSSAADEETSSSGPQMMLELNISQTSQQDIPATAEGSEEPIETPKESPKTGWFRQWFRSKTSDAQKETMEQKAAQTSLDPSPSAGFSSPPPPAGPPPGAFPSAPSAAGINPFSRKAGQQLG
ncbi:protein transport protein Sec16B [Nothobranchius furzeri]|uniref:Protein transport protein sec16 n=3 Tax=Nothobranchius TaxID=28779 RepID=A0A9D2XL05_NOTFU|nr:transcript variant X2 [Nothobranchius furzeri]KAF7203838.1 transcript variant X1 [Nothobranchius furzeri]